LSIAKGAATPVRVVKGCMASVRGSSRGTVYVQAAPPARKVAAQPPRAARASRASR